jgi:ubiquinone/menaquinone biosynthesis C-methylase UbiE
MRILNVGCGNDTYGTHFVDLYPTRKEVIKCDVNKERLPFPSNFFDVVYSRNCLST